MRNLLVLGGAVLIFGVLGDDVRGCRLFRRPCPAPIPTQTEPPRPEDLQRLEAADAGSWPYDSSLESLTAKIQMVVAATASGPAQLGKSHAAHISTRMSIGDGKSIQGGGIIISTECRQEFQITEVLHGNAKLEKRVVQYLIMQSRAFPGPSSTRAVPDSARALLLFGGKGEFLKAIPDSRENRQAVADVLSRKKAPPEK